LGQYLLVTVTGVLTENRKKHFFSLTDKLVCTSKCYRFNTSKQISNCRDIAVTNLRRDEWVWMSILLSWKQATQKLGKICRFLVIWVTWQR